MVATAYPSHAIQRQLAHGLRDSRQQKEVNYSLLISSILIAFAVTALLWLISTSSHHTEELPTTLRYQTMPRQAISPTADIAQRITQPRFSGPAVLN